VQQVQPTDVVAVVPTTTTITLEEAASLASSVIGRTDLYASENTQLNGVDAYLVTFSSGDLVYVSLDGQILSISKLPAKYVLSQPVAQNNGGGNNNSAAASSAPAVSSNNGGDDHGGEHDGGDDHDD
jgi:hypothetical protein